MTWLRFNKLLNSSCCVVLFAYLLRKVECVCATKKACFHQFASPFSHVLMYGYTYELILCFAFILIAFADKPTERAQGRLLNRSENRSAKKLVALTQQVIQRL